MATMDNADNTDLPFSPAAERNKEPILARLASWFEPVEHVLELAAGTGQHAIYFASELPWVTWQPTDLSDKLDGLRARCAQSSLPNLRPPRAFDAREPDTSIGVFDAVFMANGLQIMPWSAFVTLAQALPRITADRAQLVLYSPLRYEDRPLEPSNQRFDAMLRGRAPHMGVRCFDDICRVLEPEGFKLENDVAMPANNRMLRFRRLPGASRGRGG